MKFKVGVLMAATIKHFRDSITWQEARALDQLVCNSVRQNSAIKDFAFKYQLARPAGDKFEEPEVFRQINPLIKLSMDGRLDLNLQNFNFN